MEILVISDSHGDDAAIQQLLNQYAQSVQAVIHLGDHDRDLLQLARETSLPMYTVAGNCDDGAASPRERMELIGGHRIFMAHGNKLDVGFGVEKLARRAREADAAVCLFGHTHRSAIYTLHGIFFMNPGSITDPRDDNRPSYGLLTLGDAPGAVSGKILFL
ncbi:MAG: metallophosphoesterase [Defluviitaleaceae bacterium]|nr:metallophosphoesterase [Defluviitaleaceae bacterium]MCL2239991.1 metallophosphoesterase [Defluviitaleaceae bacterium]